MSLGLNENVRNARLQVIADSLDAAATPGTINFYTAPQPGTGEPLTTQTLVATCVLSDPAATVSAGELTFDAVSSDLSADADGTIDWARGADGDGGFVFDVDCGVALTQAEIDAGEVPAAFIFNTLVTVAGGIVQVLDGGLTEGNA